MAGYREFMPGQVWFYYNMSASKELEKKKELGACTNRPVVIIQAAFYPEWNDIITVCPITSSDRRSGVFIESTIFKDGSLIEGGTILPYLFFNVKVKFLYPLITSSHKRKILSLAPQDFEKVKEGLKEYYLNHPNIERKPWSEDRKRKRRQYIKEHPEKYKDRKASSGTELTIREEKNLHLLN